MALEFILLSADKIFAQSKCILVERERKATIDWTTVRHFCIYGISSSKQPWNRLSITFGSIEWTTEQDLERLQGLPKVTEAKGLCQ